MTDADGARAALATVGLTECEVAYLAQGLSSTAWLVVADDARLVLRMSNVPGWVDEFEREHAVLVALTGAGAAVPAAVAGSWEYPGWSGPPFSLTTFVAGQALAPTDVLAVADDVAGFLRVLHATPPPPGTIGAEQRFARAPIWPSQRADLSGHPVTADRQTRTRLEALTGQVRRALDGPQVLLHSDLHEGNIVRTETGAAFLDFGCAFVASAVWDFAALAYFLGWPTADRVLESYGSTRGREVRLAALAFALYRWAVADDDPDEAAHATAFIGQTLRLAQIDEQGSRTQ